MTANVQAVGRAPFLPAAEAQQLLFSLSSLIAAAGTLLITFAASLPRPWWALLTVYVTAQPMSGAFRPKVIYRLGGIALGATVTVALVPTLQSSPALLVICLAGWTGVCIYLAVLDRTPRAFLFQMAAFSSAVMSFPYLDAPGLIFTTTISRVEEMAIAVILVSLAHAILQPWSTTPVIRERAETFLRDGARWTLDALADERHKMEYEDRRRLGSAIAELGMIAIHLPFDQAFGVATRQIVRSLQQRLAETLPAATAVADRLARLKAHGAPDPEILQLVADASHWLREPLDTPISVERGLIRRCRDLAVARSATIDWTELVEASLCERLVEFIIAYQGARTMALELRTPVPKRPRRTRAFPIVRDHGIAALAGLATASALGLYCAVWILLAWPNGSATAAFAALITCSFAAQDDPAPVIGRYLGATLAAFPLSAIYLFVVLPRVDGYIALIMVLCPALLWIGWIQANPARSHRALPMVSCFVVALGFTDRFQPDFASFVNTGLAQIGGIVATVAITRLFRSVGVRWTARRMIRANWRDIVQLAEATTLAHPTIWTERAIDRVSQVAARMAMTAPGDELHADDGLSDLRLGRNILRLRRAARTIRGAPRATIDSLLNTLASLFRRRLAQGVAIAPDRSLLDAIDAALEATQGWRPGRPRQQARLALIGMRCNLFPAVGAF